MFPVHIQVTRIINEHGETIHVVARMVQPTLIRAARAGDVAAVRSTLHDGGAGPNTRANDHPVLGATALHIAAARGHVGVARELVAAEAHLELRDRDGLTPIERALASGGRPGCAEIAALLDRELCARATAAGIVRPSTVRATAAAEVAAHFGMACKREMELLDEIQHKLKTVPACHQVSLATLLASYVT